MLRQRKEPIGQARHDQLRTVPSKTRVRVSCKEERAKWLRRAPVTPSTSHKQQDVDGAAIDTILLPQDRQTI